MKQEKKSSPKQPLLSNKQLDKKLEELVLPLLEQIPVSLKQFEVNKMFELFSIAILKGVELAEVNNERLDKVFEDQIKAYAKKDEEEKSKQFENKIMGNNAFEAKDKAARLSVANPSPDGLPRFVTPDQIDPDTGKIKKK